ncbi:hypothetical protein BHE74_00015002 [Ensete ventricosum]|nr:hypothetical protein BHE74_00015002 [Ensete ventricosum]RZR77611.1 hypothetical protein BHM03_00002723 [Ensete ventricosum]
MIKRFVESSPKVAEKIIGTLRSTNLAEEDLGNEELDLMSADLGSLALEDLLFDMFYRKANRLDAKAVLATSTLDGCCCCRDGRRRLSRI